MSKKVCVLCGEVQSDEPDCEVRVRRVEMLIRVDNDDTTIVSVLTNDLCQACRGKLRDSLLLFIKKEERLTFTTIYNRKTPTDIRKV